MSDQIVNKFLYDLKKYLAIQNRSHEFEKYQNAVLNPPVNTDNQSSNTVLITKTKSGENK
jgi:hypothetical protein